MSRQHSAFHGFDLPCLMLLTSRVRPAAVRVCGDAKQAMHEAVSTP